MRPRGKKRARRDRQARSARAEFAQEFPYCWNCGSNWELVVDEIVSGMSDRVKGVQERLAWTRLCSPCNTDRLNGSAANILVMKLALKWVYDRPHFDLMRVNVLRGRAPHAILMQDIVPTICRRLDGAPRRA